MRQKKLSGTSLVEVKGIMSLVRMMLILIGIKAFKWKAKKTDEYEQVLEKFRI